VKDKQALRKILWPLRGRGHRHATHFLNLGPLPICGVDEDRQLWFDTYVDRGRYWQVKCKLPPEGHGQG